MNGCRCAGCRLPVHVCRLCMGCWWVVGCVYWLCIGGVLVVAMCAKMVHSPPYGGAFCLFECTNFACFIDTQEKMTNGEEFKTDILSDMACPLPACPYRLWRILQKLLPSCFLIGLAHFLQNSAKC